MKKHLFFCLLSILLLSSCGTMLKTPANTVETNNYKFTRDEYIEVFYPVAVEQMDKYGIPASITLAQGILESNNGNSTLVRNTNNHFCIKADKRWKGDRYLAPDRGGNFYFRVYEDAYESYEDHSLFLRKNKRYAELFKLKKKNYKGWAKGLKAAGYAEDEKYPSKLIGLIERHNLDKYDSYSYRKIPDIVKRHSEMVIRGKRQIYIANELLYIVAGSRDNLKSIAKEMGLSRSKILKYNDLYKGYNIKKGDIIYLEKKNSKAQKKYTTHRIEQNESLHSVSQRYGIRLKRLLKMNPQYKESAPGIGDIIRLR